MEESLFNYQRHIFSGGQQSVYFTRQTKGELFQFRRKMQAVWDLEQGKYGFGMFAYCISLSLSPLSHFSPCAMWVWGWLGAFQKIGLLTCMHCLGLWLKGWGGAVNSVRCHILLHVCGSRGGRGGEIQLQSCQNMIKPKHKDCGCLPSPHPVFSNSFPSIELTENQS